MFIFSAFSVMDETSYEIASRIVGKTYCTQAREAASTTTRQFNDLLEHRKWPVNGWDPELIELFLFHVSRMDSNNFAGNAGLGEREGRVLSTLVRRRHFGLAHGIGRSGDLLEIQPKAAGSSLLSRLSSQFALQFVRFCGVGATQAACIAPLATGKLLVYYSNVVNKLITIKNGLIQILDFRIDSCFRHVAHTGYAFFAGSAACC